MRGGLPFGRELYRSRRVLKALLTAAAAIPLSGCLLPADKPNPALDIPASYDGGPKSETAATAALPPLDWWRSFRSRELTAIIEQVRADNLDIAAAVARIVQADAQSRVTGAALLPAVGLDGSGTQSKSSANSGTGTVSRQYNASLTASYELDFWGKNRALLRAAEETAIASRYDREVVGLSAVSAAATAYFQMLTTQERLGVARENVASATRVLNLIKQRLAAGTASELDTAQQQSLVNTQRATIPPLEQTLRQNRNTLAVLMARPPEHIAIRGGSLRSVAVPRVTPGLPSQLLGQRPDIRQAEAQLEAAGANVANARAQMLPSISLTGEGGYQSAVFRSLFFPASAFYSATAGLTQPIFEGGRLLGNLELQKARQDELLQNYRKAVLSSFADVENALDAIRQTTRREQIQRDVVTSSRLAFQISEQRLREGTVDLVTVLNTQQTLYQAQDALAQARLDRLQAVLSLYQALGGGWLPKPPEDTDEK